MSIISLNINKGFSWFSNEVISVKGCFFDTENNYYEKENLISFFTNIKSEKQFISKIKNINGIFTILIKLNNQILIATDTTRKFPLFYTFKNECLFISDDVLYLKNKFNINTINSQSEIEFKAAGYTLGNKTLLNTVFQIQSNEYIIFEKNKIKTQGFFFLYTTNTAYDSSYALLEEKTIKVINNAFQRFILSLNNRTVVIPLSGGFDSRLIVALLKKYNYKKVICFTYGKQDSFEIENSKKTAKILNYKWLFVEYSKKIIENYVTSKTFKEYTHYTGKHSSMPFLQEYFAVKYLKENNLIPKDSIFTPGYLIDFLSGSQIIKAYPDGLKIKEISKLITKKKFVYNSTSKTKKNEIKKIINNLLYDFDANYKLKYPHSVFENYDLKEKTTKLIFNAANTYSFFDYECRFPFCDKELISFFKNVPIKFKKKKLLYNNVLKNYYFKKYNLNFHKELQPSLYNLYIQTIKNKIKPFLPYFITKKFLIKNDWLNSEFITKQMVISMKKNNLPVHTKIKAYNELNIQWYLYFCKGLIKK
ncbi:asparagine synthase-related protein [Lutibacter sp.]